MDTKFTKDGRKVAVLGKLNDTTWIVQEIYVSDKGEFPAGENFTTKTLLDEPAETYSSRRAKEIDGQIEKRKKERDLLDTKLQLKRRKSQAAELINHATAKYENLDVAQLDTFLAFIAGEITHVVVEDYSNYQIVCLVDAVEAVDGCHSRRRLEGLKLVSLFGCTDRGARYKEGQGDDHSLSLDWRINQYRDGSGNSWDTVYPCKSHEEAVLLLDGLLADKDATEKRIKLKEEYKLVNPTAEKIEAYRQRRIDDKRGTVAKRQEDLDKAKAELEAIEKS